MKVIYNKHTQRVPIKVWSELETVESAALDQLENIASLPFVFKHVAAMPDVHLGKGATVGSVVATQGAVCPCAVGVDIGCGMMAMKLNIEPSKIIDNTRAIRDAIEHVIPVGHESNTSLIKSVENWQGWATWPGTTLEAKMFDRAKLQLGTLGGGNHFIELCTDQDGTVWVMLHSGSRNVGKVLAEIHIDKAKADMKKMFISLADPELAYFVEGTEDYRRYMKDLMWAQDYAAENRQEMMRRVIECISGAIGFSILEEHTEMVVNCHHNYASMEHHYGENCLITRKGAVRARVGDLGIIPGSMGTRSYIVEGLGNPESFHSCSHGAGRRMSRSEAKRQFTLADVEKQTAGVDCRKDEGIIDELPGAYKDIDVVMENQKDLVKVVAQLKQFMCIKG